LDAETKEGQRATLTRKASPVMAGLFLIIGCTQPVVPLPAPAVELPAPKAIPVVAPKLIATPTGIPQDALRWKADLRRAAQSEWGLSAPVATMGAQIHQESSWRADAVSPVGASGLAQFMPATATWLSGVDATVGPSDPTNPMWAMRALASYDRRLWDETLRMTDDCNRMAVALAKYNGGPSRAEKERQLCAATPNCDPNIWWGNADKFNSGRSKSNWDENRQYPKRILLVLEPRYMVAGWGDGVCAP
jgi:hypothetical protein